MKTGIEIIAEERKTHPDKGWTSKHDENHEDGSIGMAAACYAAPDPIFIITKQDKSKTIYDDPFPWGYTQLGRSMMDSDIFTYSTTEEKKEGKSRIRQLAIAGALMAAEIDRIQNDNKATGL